MSAKKQCRSVRAYVCVQEGGQDARDTLSKQALPPFKGTAMCACASPKHLTWKKKNALPCQHPNKEGT